MIKAIELIVVVTLMIFSFVVGVKYSESVKSHASWLFETKEEEVDLPDLTNDNSPESAPVYDNGGAVDNGDQMPSDNAPAAVENNSEIDEPTQPASSKK
ncbi:MAG: hypothetical protein EBS06_02965 [Proteobacteria bacterium]|nr:hypothetical protein [Pseudomonadota bacterium]